MVIYVVVVFLGGGLPPCRHTIAPRGVGGGSQPCTTGAPLHKFFYLSIFHVRFSDYVCVRKQSFELLFNLSIHLNLLEHETQVVEDVEVLDNSARQNMVGLCTPLLLHILAI